MYNLKCKFMKKMVDKKKKAKPFDFKKAEEFSLDSSMDETINNSYYFSAHKDTISFYCRLGLRNNINEVWVCFVDGDNSYHLNKMYYEHDETPLKIKKENNKYLIVFDGVLQNEDERKHFTINAVFTNTHDPIDFFFNMPSIRLAKAMSFEKWNKGYFKRASSNNQTHYEQEGILELSLLIDCDSRSFTLPCVRDHSFGKRDWNYMNNHLWMMALGKDIQFNYSLVSYPTMTILEVGNYRYKDTTNYLMKASYNKELINKGKLFDEIEMKILLDNKKTIIVKAKTISEVPYSFQNGDYTLIEGIGEYYIDGVKCKGIIEIGFNKDSNRFFNNIDLKRLKQ